MGLKNWLWSIALTKGTKEGIPASAAALAGYAVGLVATPAVGSFLAQAGVTLDPEILQGLLTAKVTLLLTGGVKVVRNFLKHKVPGLSWL